MRLAFLIACAALPVFCGDWSPRLAAGYLDSRQKEWFGWKAAAGQGGPCISCHTGVSYLLSRPALRRALGEHEATSYETGLLDGLRARLQKREPSSAASLGTETVLAALLLGPENGSPMTTEAQQAFDRLWAIQITEGKSKGAWPWFNLDLEPWEEPESKYFGATYAAMAVGRTPAEYRNRPDVRDHVNSLIEYLKEEQPSQPLHNRLMLLWASTRLPEALPKPMRKPLIEEVWKKQEADGGWAIQSLGPFKEHAAAPRSEGSNSYATAMVAFILQRAGTTPSDPRFVRALAWLKTHQNREGGYWAADSLNKQYEPDSIPKDFMRDAATGFATLALLEAEAKH
jgi:hypothetical protein